MTNRRTPWVRHAWLAIAGALVVFACGDDYVFVPDPVPDAGVPDGEAPDGGEDGGIPDQPPSTPTACTTDDDCAALSNTQLCDQKAGYCVECDPAREAELDRCGTGTFCAIGGHCVLGCQSDVDCLGTSCDTTRGLCVNCQSDSNCAPGTVCQDAVCSPGCSANEGCPLGWSCCDGTCKNPETDTSSCGTCGKECNEGDSCWNGVCGEPPCEPGSAECDGDASNGCETLTQDDPENCGKCHLTCASNFCAGGRCTTMECAPGTADCNGDEDDHCETDITTVTDCKTCDTKCSDVHGEPSCGKDGCEIACADGYESCDGKVANGCEIDLNADEKHCGDCDTECSNDHGSTKCEDGECVPRCGDGFEDCDGDASNGCETDTDTSLDDCGACGQKCDPDNATGTCKAGVCRPKCEAGFEDCDGDKANGCEADLGSPKTCGSCDNACSNNGGKPTCNPDDGTCTIKCDVGRADCVNGLADGCETDTTASAANCGGCGNACTSSVGTPACQDSTCGVSQCTAPLETCPGAGKCQTNLSNDAQNCGDCGHMCAFPSASGKCVNKLCELDQCDSGHKDCNGVPTDGCEIALGTKDNCRSCGESCANAHGDNACTSNGCSPTCASGWGDCDGNKNNGCETPLNTLSDCGSCGQACTKSHGTAACSSSGVCSIVACNAGWEDCSANENSVKDGCETQLNTSTNCGGCGVPCAPAHATGSCGTGQCLITSCNAGYQDCSSSTAGCETALFTDTNCSTCGDSCLDNHAANACDATTHVCKPVCSSGYKSCDGNTSNGCETQVNTATNCGDCGVLCTNPPNAMATCSTGSCVVTCDGTHLDCTSAAGCETTKGNTTNCRTCGESCSNAHGAAGCSLSTGCTYSCDPLFDNCDSNANNGCETSLTTLTNCATCGTKCDFTSSSESCATGTCTATTCDPGTDDCDTNAGNGCETDITTVSNCGSCNHVCTPLNGTTSCAGSPRVCTPACSPGYKSCDNNPDNGCERNVVTLSDCGNCGTSCSFPNAPATCTIAGTTITCNMGTCNGGYADCSSSSPGCETTLGTTTNCATCGNACTNAHGTNPCQGSPGTFACVPSCDPGFGNCDNNAPNGCESQLNSATNCGACGVSCLLPHSTASCSSGSCTVTDCSPGYLDCNLQPVDGCEIALGTKANCAACGNACVDLNSVNGCSGTLGNYDCSPTCSPGYKSCDADPDNGCERSVTTLSDCGDCNVGCSRTNATPTCATGTCAIDHCTGGFGNCDGNDGNGCETTLGTPTNCSACGDVCSNSHGGYACTNRACVPSCDAGWGDCDGIPSNGCETSLTTQNNCGSCNNKCTDPVPACVSSNGTLRCESNISHASTDVSALINNGTSVNPSHTLAGSATDNRVVIVGVLAGTLRVDPKPNPGIAAAKPDVITYGGVAMTLYDSLDGLTVPPTDTDTYRASHLFLYYLTDTGTNKLPTTGTNPRSVVVNAASGTVGTDCCPNYMVATVSQYNNVHQTAPFMAVSKFISRTKDVDPSVTVTMPMGNTWLYGIATGYYVGTASAIGFTTTTMNATPLDEGQTRALAGYVGPFAWNATPNVGFNYTFSQKVYELVGVLQPLHVP